MNIGLDFDDVIVHSHLLKPVIARSLYGVEIDPARFRKEFVVGEFLTREQYQEVGRKVFSGEYPLTPVVRALETIDELLAEGHFLRIVTNRSHEKGTLQPALDWMREYELKLPITGVPYGTSKAEACKNLDLFVDDDSNNLHNLVGHVRHLLFFCWPNNRHEKEPESAVRVHTWADINRYVRKTES